MANLYNNELSPRHESLDFCESTVLKSGAGILDSENWEQRGKK